LVGLALNKPTTYALSIGYFSPDQENSLSESFMEEIKNSNYLILKYENLDLCVNAIKQGVIHTCIVFPENFEVGNQDFNNIEFHVDYSRANLVYQIIDAVSEKFNLRTAELSKDLTQVLLTRILEARKDIDENILALITTKSSIDTIVSNIQETKSEAEGMDFSMGKISFNEIETTSDELFDDAKDLKNEGLDAISKGRTFADGLSNTSTTTFKGDLDEIESNIDNIFNSTPNTLEELKSLIDNATSEISSLETKLSASSTKNQAILNDLDNAKTSLENLKIETNNLKTKLESTNVNLENIDIISAESIVSPIRTEIKPVVSESNQLAFVYPYLLMLVMMFIGVMLSSTLILMEKQSKASFRNFTTPTKDEFFVFTTFFTSFLVLIVQVIVILGLSYYFLKAQIFANFVLTTSILLISASIFILVGMTVGYMSETQEAATMLSIAVGSVFLLLSNLILPVETMSEVIKNLTAYNPYVVSSELLKKALLFKINFSDAITDFLFLTSFMIILVIIVFVVNKLSRMTFMKKTPHAHKGFIYLPEDCYLKINQFTLKNKEDVLKTLKNISDEDFEKHVKKKNDIANWVSSMLKERRLAWKLRFKNRDKMIMVIKKHLEREQKKAEKKTPT
jgi:ABC-type multidrug transport system permease subunit